MVTKKELGLWRKNTTEAHSKTGRTRGRGVWEERGEKREGKEMEKNRRRKQRGYSIKLPL